jgi:chemotaxis protein methyltransferase CheR
VTPAIEPRDVVRFREMILARTGMAFPDKRTPDLERAIRRATAEAGLPTASALYDLVVRTPGISVTFDGLASALNVSETHFFRDQGQVEELRSSILPELAARRREDRRLRIWSAGCSTGEEPYTLAILLRQLIADLSGWDVLILATDINGASLEHARRGIYREWSFRGIPATRVRHDFLRRGDLFEVVPAIRRMVTFARLNLAEPVYPSVATNTYGMDLILCRNVLLYFDRAQAHAVVARLRSSLDDAGRLIVSRVDSSLPIFEGLQTDRPGSGVFTKAHPTDLDAGALRGGASAPVTHPPGRLPGVSRPRDERRASPIRQTDVPRSLVPSGRSDPAMGSIEPASAEPRAAYDALLAAWRSSGPLEARSLLDRALADNPLDAALHYLDGLILLEQGDVAGALRGFRRSIYADPEFALAHLGQGTAFARAGHSDRARAALEKASRLVADLDPQDTVFAPDGLTAAEVLEFVAAERALLRPGATREVLRA